MAITKVSLQTGQIMWVVGKATKRVRTFTNPESALAYRDAMNDMRKDGLL
jgi:hypothetical protein